MLAYKFLRYEVRDGSLVSFRFDVWLGIGRLIEKTGEYGPRYFGVPRTATVSEAVLGTCWSMRSRGRRVYHDLYC